MIRDYPPTHSGHVRSAYISLLLCSCALLTACSGGPLVGAAGPSTGQVKAASRQEGSPVRLVDVTPELARKIVAADRSRSFADTLPDAAQVGTRIGLGDVIDVTLWEAPPAALFGTGSTDTRTSSLSGTSTARSVTLPEMMVTSSGSITVPFVGSINVDGRRPQDVEAEIARRLQGRANHPQALVRIVRNAAANVTVVGEVVNSIRMPLTAKGERLLDAIAASGGSRQPIGKLTLQVTRGNQVQAMPLDSVVRDPSQNILLQANDVVTVLYRSLSFTALGATGKNDEVEFEANGITLSQALGRVGGLQDMRANPSGVFIFRFEDPSLFGATAVAPQDLVDGKMPVIYRVNLREAETFFTAQSFPIRNKDVLYVTNAPLADIQKFVNIVSSTIFPIASFETIVR